MPINKIGADEPSSLDRAPTMKDIEYMMPINERNVVTVKMAIRVFIINLTPPATAGKAGGCCAFFAQQMTGLTVRLPGLVMRVLFPLLKC